MTGGIHVIESGPNNGILQLTKSEPVCDDMLPENLKSHPTSNCTRCKKDFAQLETKLFKRCNHCRELQRLRTKRWQTETRQKEGVCSRCRTVLSDNKYSLCIKCRGYLRNNKETRLLRGKCVHCSGSNDESDIYKVCKKCRIKDKARRLTLEQEGLCIRCTSRLSKSGMGQKMCLPCKLKKKAFSVSNCKGNNKELFDAGVPADVSTVQIIMNSNEPVLHKPKHECLADHVSKQKQPEIPESESRKVEYTNENENVNMPDYDEQSLEDKILESFTLHHDHSQLNQQLKRLSQYTNDNNGNSMDVDVSKYSDEQSVLVDLNGLDDIEITYNIENEHEHDVEDEEEEEDDEEEDDERDIQTDALQNNYRQKDNDADIVQGLEDQNAGEDEAENESMLRHIRAVQAGLLSNDSEPSEAEIVAAVEAVAAAAAAVVANNKVES